MSVLPRRFELYRHVDVSGVSGTGVVAYGCLYPNGIATLCWLSPHPAVSIWQSLADMLAIHGHDGDTELLWLDDMPARFAEAHIGVSVHAHRRGGVPASNGAVVGNGRTRQHQGGASPQRSLVA